MQEKLVETIEDQSFNFQRSLESVVEKLEVWLHALVLKLPNIVLAIIIIVAFIFFAKFAGRGIKKLLRKRISQRSILEITVKIFRVTIILIGFFIALGVLELDKALTTILGAAGVLALAVGLALQGTLNNTFSGVFLSFMPKLNLGDWIDTNGYEGEVKEISMRNIVIHQGDNNYVIIPNSKIIEEPFTNYTISPRSRISVSCGVSYESDLQQVEELVIRVIGEAFPTQPGEETEFFYTEFGDSSINFITRFWTASTRRKQFLTHQSTAIKIIRAAFIEQGINIPYPIRTIDFSNKLRMATPEPNNDNEKK